jgi:hypothetical protein
MDEKETIKQEPKKGKGEPIKTEKKKTGWLEKKAHLEFVAAVLSVPLLISLLILNFNSVKNLINAKPTPTPTNAVVTKEPINSIPEKINTIETKTSVPISSEPCTQKLGTTTIASPDEGDVVTDNPVSVTISYDTNNNKYCAAAWSYRINNGAWSGYDDKSIALYDLPKGNMTFELRIKSIIGTDSQTLTRHFTYNGQSSTIIPTSASDSAR